MLITKLLDIKKSLLAKNHIVDKTTDDFLLAFIKTTYDAIVDLQNEYGLKDDKAINQLLAEINTNLAEQFRLKSCNTVNVEMTASKVKIPI